MSSKPDTLILRYRSLSPADRKLAMDIAKAMEKAGCRMRLDGFLASFLDVISEKCG